jgi:hypothetical protein
MAGLMVTIDEETINPTALIGTQRGVLLKV